MRSWRSGGAVLRGRSSASATEHGGLLLLDSLWGVCFHRPTHRNHSPCYLAPVLTPDALLSRIDDLRQARIKDQRAPHKPLLLLYLLGRLDSVGSSAVSYKEAEPQVSRLIAEFGPPAASRHRAAMPFFYLDRSLWRLSPQATRAQHGHLLGVEAEGSFCGAGTQDSVRLSLSSTRTLALCVATTDGWDVTRWGWKLRTSSGGHSLAQTRFATPQLNGAVPAAPQAV